MSRLVNLVSSFAILLVGLILSVPSARAER